MKHIAWLFALAFISCNNTPQTNTQNKDTAASSAQPGTDSIAQKGSTLSGCYLAVTGRDTIRLQLQVEESLVTGTMQYDNFEVDGNIGTIEGVLNNGRISGHFTFFAEGMWSVREIIFEARNGQLLQANTNNMNYEKDTVRFSSTQNLPFDEDRPFTHAPCSTMQFPEMPPQNVSNPF